MERRDNGGLTTGQRLRRIEERLDRLIASLEASQARLTALETANAVAVALRSNRRLVVGSVLAMGGWGGVLVAAVGLVAAHPWAH